MNIKNYKFSSAALILGSLTVISFFNIPITTASKPFAPQVTFTVEGDATFILIQKLDLLPGTKSLTLQKGKIIKDIDDMDFIKAPQCHVHFNDLGDQKEIIGGFEFKIAEIENFYKNGNGTLVFRFLPNPIATDFTCRSHGNHPLKTSDLREIFGNYFQVRFSKSVETSKAFLNTATNLKNGVLRENSPPEFAAQAVKTVIKQN